MIGLMAVSAYTAVCCHHCLLYTTTVYCHPLPTVVSYSPQSPAFAPICLANLMNTSSSVAFATPQSNTASPAALLPAMVANTRLKVTCSAHGSRSSSRITYQRAAEPAGRSELSKLSISTIAAASFCTGFAVNGPQDPPRLLAVQT